MDKVKEFINELCELLNIESVKVVYNDDLFVTSTQLALFNSQDNTIFLSNKSLTVDTFFSIAHELRHKWQIINDENKYFTNYKSSIEVDVDTYNLQIAELDANAFAAIIMSDFFQLKPQFKGLKESTKTKIFNHIDVIIKEFK